MGARQLLSRLVPWLDSESTGVPRLVDVQVRRETPIACLRALRLEVSPVAELVYVADGKWWLGEMQYDAPRRETGTKLLAGFSKLELPREQAILMAHLLIQGFALLGEYRFQGEPSAGHMIQDFRRADWLYRMERERTFERMLAESDGTRGAIRRRSRLQEYIDGEARDIARFAFRRPVSSVVSTPLFH